MTVDRNNRDKLADTIGRFQSGEITSFAFNDEIDAIAEDSSDETINFVAGELWFFYDDIDDLPARLDKKKWDYLERLRLLLESDAQCVRVRGKREFCVSNFVALVGLGIFATAIAVSGLGLHVFAVSVPLGLLTLLIAFMPGLKVADLTPEEVALYPFASFAELRTVRQSVASFKKQRYCDIMPSRRFAAWIGSAARYFSVCVIWMLFSPILLLVQSTPGSSDRGAMLLPTESY